MTTIEDYGSDEQFKKWSNAQRRGRICGGLMVLSAGILFFMKEAGCNIPAWIFTWPVLLIAIGIIAAIKHKFRHAGWIVLITIGGVFLAADILPGWSLEKYTVPIILTVVGLLIIFKPRNAHKHYMKHQCRKHGHHRWNVAADNSFSTSTDEFISVNNVFAVTKKNIISKEFKGGDIRNVFGGCEINLMQADFTGEASMNIIQNFGGTKLIVPANWVIKSDVSCIMAGIEDHRAINNNANLGETKTLVLKGQVVMGGIEIVSY